MMSFFFFFFHFGFPGDALICHCQQTTCTGPVETCVHGTDPVCAKILVSGSCKYKPLHRWTAQLGKTLRNKKIHHLHHFKVITVSGNISSSIHLVFFFHVLTAARIVKGCMSGLDDCLGLHYPPYYFATCCSTDLCNWAKWAPCSMRRSKRRISVSFAL